ncbi:hypothetical protein DRP77_00330 [Candidatus Poribacteria bacterium]|nr:MAG: hypothetical protein DRP77_00330 [Candidatus Poribacteria bacterium]
MKAILIAFLTALSFLSWAAQAGEDSGGKISLDVQDVDVRALLRALAEQAGVNLVLGEEIKGKVSVILKDVTPMEAIEAVLNSIGYTIEEGKGYIKPVPAVRTEVFKLKHADASALKEVISSALKLEDIQIDRKTNSLIITCAPDLLSRVKELIDEFDVETEEKTLKLFRLKNASARSALEVITGFLSKDGRAAAEEGTNSLIVYDLPERIDLIAELLSRIDAVQPLPGKGIAVEVFKLKYIDANSAAEAVKQLLSPQGKAFAFLPQKSMITPLEPERAPAGYGARPIYYRGETAAPGARREEFEEKWSDTLIVIDTPDVIDRVRSLIRKLDVKPEQVLIEARIVEISTDASLGLRGEIEWGWELKGPETQLKGVFSSAAQESPSGIELGKVSIDVLKELMMKIRALEAEGKAKVLASPRMTTLDNELAQIIVSDRIPIATVYATERFTTTSYEYLDVGIILTVIPHINEDGSIILDVNPRIDSIKEISPSEEIPPVISSRVAHSRVIVRDGETVVIGGLMREERSERVERLPILGKLPIIGSLFSFKSQVRKKTDVLVFITPKIIR